MEQRHNTRTEHTPPRTLPVRIPHDQPHPRTRLQVPHLETKREHRIPPAPPALARPRLNTRRLHRHTNHAEIILKIPTHVHRQRTPVPRRRRPAVLVVLVVLVALVALATTAAGNRSRDNVLEGTRFPPVVCENIEVQRADAHLHGNVDVPREVERDVLGHGEEARPDDSTRPYSQDQSPGADASVSQSPTGLYRKMTDMRVYV